ncbi:MAG: ATP-binding protein, partial [Verrucomicrobiota bacterium]|nr:ATP-binding protein [Verrucomicrobiota bacterium]
MPSATQLQDETAMPDSAPRRNGHRSKNAHEKNRPSLPGAPHESAEHLALAARATNDAVRVWDVKAGRLNWPQGFETLLGYAPSIVSNEIGFWQRHVHPDDRARIAASIRDALVAGGPEHWHGEYRFRRADGDYLLLLERALIVRDAHGRALQFVGSLMDITARRQLQDQLCRSQRMEAFGQLAGGVAHDFNNFLTTILGYSSLLLDELSVKGSVAKHLGEIRAAAGRAAALTSQLLAFSRRHPLDARVLEVNTLLNNLERSFLRLVGENITVQCELHRGQEPAHIKVDPGQLTQIILNLVVNARDALPRGGRIWLSTGTVRIHDHAAIVSNAEELAPGDYVSISVRDNGIGMNAEVKARLFEPFFTTKEDSHGSGLGLATSYGIVRQSGGHIRVESEPACGTTVTIYIPKVPAPAPLSYKKAPSGSLPTGTETVLVVEDDISVRHIAVRVLRGLGYDVIEAANGDDAQRIIAADA